MKKHRIDSNGMFVCEECGESFRKKENLSKHVKHHGISKEYYYDKWLKEEGDGICKECGAPIDIRSKYCSLPCKRKGAGKTHSLHAKIKREITFEYECKECNEKIETLLKLARHIIKKHGSKLYYDNHLKNEMDGKCKICGADTKFTGKMWGTYSGYEMCCSSECREKYKMQERTVTNKIKYGVDNTFQLTDKIQLTNIGRYGEKYASLTNDCKEKARHTCLNRYGENSPTQNIDILEKGQRTARTLKQYKDTQIWYQGSYELNFLDTYYGIFPDLKRGSTIKYVMNGNVRSYHPDFYIPSLNIIIEIKSKWTLKLDKEISYKKKAVINNGFRYLMILDKDYSKFEEEIRR